VSARKLAPNMRETCAGLAEPSPGGSQGPVNGWIPGISERHAKIATRGFTKSARSTHPILADARVLITTLPTSCTTRQGERKGVFGSSGTKKHTMKHPVNHPMNTFPEKNETTSMETTPGKTDETSHEAHPNRLKRTCCKPITKVQTHLYKSR
jgi:hypothetical protein